MRIVMTMPLCSLLIVCLLSIFSCLEAVPDQKELEEALDLVEKRDYSQADEILKILIPKLKEPGMKAKYRYLAATCYRKLERREEAISYYESVLEESGFMFADLAKLHIARLYKNLEDYESAVEWYETFLRDHPYSSYAVEAQYQIGECYFEMKQYEPAIAQYGKFMEMYPEEARVRAGIYKIGRAYQELQKWPEAYIQYQKVIRQNMRDEITRNALGNINLLILEYPTLTITREDRLYYGMASYYAGQYKAAREELKKVIEGADDLSAKAAYYIAESYYREREYTTAIEAYTSVIEGYPQSDYAVSSEYQIAICYWRTGKEEKSNELLASFAATYPENNLADNAEFQIAANYASKEEYEEAIDAYSKVVSKYPASSLADDALWNVGWYYVKLKDNVKSEQTLRRLMNEYPDSSLAGAARFWIGVNYEKMEKWQEAVDAYKQVIQKGEWYYSDRAKMRIESLAKRGKIAEELASVQYQKVKIGDSDLVQQKIEAPLPIRAQELLDIRIFDDAAGELSIAARSSASLENIYYNLSVCYEKMGNFSDAWRYAWRLLQLSGVKVEGRTPLQLQRMSYPIVYKDTVLSSSSENGIDHLLMLALMREESRYAPAAVSSAGARGLTQIMPPTGRDIASRLKIQPYNTEMLFQPELNIKMGTWYLGGLASRFNDRVSEALASDNPSEYSDIVKILALGGYNAGESRVRRWVEEFGIEDIDEFVENIPFSETKRYIKKVCDSYEMYKFLYIE
jgi:soluble lytic murein transglycosylase